MKTLEEIKQQYPEIPIGRAKDIRGQTFGKGIIPLYRTDNRGRAVRFICTAPCGHYFLYDASNLTKGNRVCPICFKEKNDLTNQKFGKLTALYPTNKRSNGHIIWHCKCDCGNECDVNASKLKEGSVKSCGCLIKETVANNLEGQRFGKLIVINDSGLRSNDRHIIWHCKCDCGNECNISSNKLISGNTKSCGCLGRSAGEWKIKELLTQNHINFETEKTFIDCRNPKTKKLLKFDFYLPEFNYCIEYDGIQHFDKNSGWKEPIEDIQYRDNLKNQYCKEHNIPLIRIPYTQYDNLSLEDLILKTSTFII